MLNNSNPEPTYANILDSPIDRASFIRNMVYRILYDSTTYLPSFTRIIPTTWLSWDNKTQYYSELIFLQPGKLKVISLAGPA